LGATKAAKTATKTALATTAKVSAKNVAKHAEYVVHIHVLATAKTTGTRRKCLVTKLIILLAFLRIAQHFVGFGSLLEFLFSFFVIRVAVRVIFQGHFAISFLDLIRRSAFVHTQYIVKISFRHIRLSLLNGNYHTGMAKYFVA
jgi:uncharacterized membrane protein